jgi:hypothetical protein
LLGFYEDFPVFPHAKAEFTCTVSTKTLQEAIVTTAHNLNSQEYDLNAITTTKIGCKIGFEFGIAEGANFNYLDLEEVERFRKSLTGKETVFNTDFLCIVKYHVTNGSKRHPLRFDNYMLRFIFRKPQMQLRVFHEKGTQRLSLEELIEFFTKQVNIELEKMEAKPLRLKSLMHPVSIERL